MPDPLLSQSSATIRLQSDAEGYCIEVPGKTPVYLKDKDGTVTLERFPWIETFLSVAQVGEEYEILWRNKKGHLRKWRLDRSGKMYRRDRIVEQDSVLATNQHSEVGEQKALPSADAFPSPNKVIIHCCYHKVATTFFASILRRIAHRFGWVYQGSPHKTGLRENTNITVFNHSDVHLERIPHYVGSHIIRDPRDIIVSGYFYHLWCDEEWCLEKKSEYENRSYQEVLNSLPQDKGMELEIARVKKIVKNMISWNYEDSNMIEITLEELAANEKGVFVRVFEKYGFNPKQMDIAMGIVEELSFEKRTGRKRGEENRRSHLRKGVPGDWRNHFTQEHKALFKKLYPGAVAKLGYEQDDNW